MKKNLRKKLLYFINNKFIQSIIYSPFLDYHQWALLKFVKRESKKISVYAKIIDVGAGELRYKKYFDHCTYISNDLCVGDKEWYFDLIDIKSSIYEIPCENESFDAILCTQVLEHLEYPELAFKEFFRILKPGGKLILTAPLGQGEHQVPYDYFRYTRYGLESLGARVGLEIKSIEPQGGIFINLEYVLWQAVVKFVPFRRIVLVRYFLYIILLLPKAISSILFIMLDIFDKKKEYTNNYNCVYEKK